MSAWFAILSSGREGNSSSKSGSPSLACLFSENELVFAEVLTITVCLSLTCVIPTEDSAVWVKTVHCGCSAGEGGGSCGCVRSLKSL